MATIHSTTSFSQDGNYLAYTGTDGVLNILETLTGNPIADFTPYRQLTVICSMKWNGVGHLKSLSPSVQSPRKKKRKSEVKIGDMLAVGTTSGQILVYSLSRGQQHTQLDKGHTAEVTDICWHTPSLFTSSLDGFVIEWDLTSSHIKQKWKASNSGVHSICLCGSNRLLTADRSIKMWDLASKTVIQKFTGHSTEVFRLLPVLQQTSGGEEDEGGSEGSGCSYFVSAATNDKTVNVWLCQPGSSEKNAVASLSLPEEPADLTLQVTREQMLILAAVVKGKVYIFQHTLNGKLKKPLKPTTVVHATTEGSREEVPVPVPIMAAMPTAADSDCPHLLVVHGSLISPRCTSLALRPTRAEIPLVVPKPEKKVKKADKSSAKKKSKVEDSTVLNCSHNDTAGPDTESGSSKRKRQKTESKTLKERLEAMEVDGPAQASPGSAKLSKAEQLVVHLTQGLKNQDDKLLTSVFEEQKEVMIQNAVKTLPRPVLCELLREVAKRMHSHPSRGILVTKWLKQILKNHMEYIQSVPEMMEIIKDLMQFVVELQQAQPRRLEIKAKVDSLLARIASQSHEDAPSPPEGCLAYQDESDSDQEALMEFGASESEGNWEESDED